MVNQMTAQKYILREMKLVKKVCRKREINPAEWTVMCEALLGKIRTQNEPRFGEMSKQADLTDFYFAKSMRVKKLYRPAKMTRPFPPLQNGGRGDLRE